MKITKNQLKAIAPSVGAATGDQLVFWINEYSEKYQINTPVRMAAFLAQAAHESGGFTSFRENLMYTNSARLMKIFPKYFQSVKIALQYIGKPTKIGNRVYANRLGNGPEASGDGYKYRGGGIFQTTGKDNYKELSEHIYADANILLERPGDITTPTIAVQSAMFYWQKNNLNELADQGDFKNLTKRINGGLNGYKERMEYWERAKKAFDIVSSKEV